MSPVYIIFESAKLKLGQAEEHIKALEGEINEFFKTKPYNLDTEIRSDGCEFITKVSLSKEPPKRFGLLAGDCLHNLRSALDHVAFDLAGRPADEDIARNIEFPIFDAAARYKTHSPKRLVGVAKGAKAIIKGLQPYNRPDFMSPGAPYPLRILYELSNRDKHRELHIAGLALREGTITVGRGGKILDHRIRRGPLEDGTEIARFTINTPKVVVQTHYTFSVTIKLRQPRGAVIVDAALWHILDFIRAEVVKPLSRPEFFTHGAYPEKG